MLSTKETLYYGCRDTLSLMINEHVVFQTGLRHEIYSIIKQCASIWIGLAMSIDPLEMSFLLMKEYVKVVIV